MAGIGVVTNPAIMMLFMADRKADLNIRGAFVHMAANAHISLGIVLTGIVIPRDYRIAHATIQWERDTRVCPSGVEC